MVENKTAGEVQAMRAAGRVVAQILAAVRDQAKAGVRLTELDEIARDVLAGAGATSPFLGYHPRFAPVPFPAVICTSVNDAALHGIPDPLPAGDGDLLSVDCGAALDGWAADAAISFTIGRPTPHPTADARLIATTERRAAARDRRGGTRRADWRHLRGHRRGRAGGRLRDLHRFRRSRHRPDDARGSRTSRTRDWPAAAVSSSPGSSSRSSRGSWPAARTATGSTTTAGRSAAATAAARPTSSTPSPLPPTALRSLPSSDRPNGRRCFTPGYLNHLDLVTSQLRPGPAAPPPSGG